MTPFLEGLIEELKDYEAGRARRLQSHTDRARIAVASEDLRVLALLRAETSRAAALAAAVTSLANRNADDPGRPASAKPPVLTPSFTASIDAQVGRLAANETFFELHQLWLAVRARLLFVSQLTAAHAAEAGTSGVHATFTTEVVADAWCRSCSLLVDFLALVSRTMSEAGVVAAPPHEAQVVALLEQAAAGRSPCIDDQGRFSMPGWAERRRDRRRRIALPITIKLGLSSFKAVIENLSSKGMLVKLGLVAPEGSRVTVVLPDGRQMAAAIRWCDGDRAGLVLAERLGDDDPMWTAKADRSRLPHDQDLRRQAARPGRSAG